MKNMWILIGKENTECWYHTQKITWCLLFVLGMHCVQTHLHSFGSAILLASPLFCISTLYSSFCFKLHLTGLQKKKMLAISECPVFSDQSPFQTHVRLIVFPIICFSNTLFCKIHTNKADWWKKHEVFKFESLFFHF